MKNLAYCGIFMLGLGVLVISAGCVYENLDHWRNRGLRGPTAGTYETDMDYDFED